MDKRLLASACCSLFLLGTPRAYAGDFTVYGSHTEFEDGGSSYGFGMKAGLPLGTPMLELEPRGGYYRDIAADDLPRVQLIPLELGLSLNALPGARINPHVSAGGGYHFLRADEGDIDDSWGFYVGGGAEIRLADSVALTTELLYRYIGEAHWSERHIEPDSVAVNIGMALLW